MTVALERSRRTRFAVIVSTLVAATETISRGWLLALKGLRGQTSIAERLRFDNHYVENWSLVLDLRILALTVVELLRLRDGRPSTPAGRSRWVS